MTIHFYYAPMTSAMRIHWALEELGVPYEKHKLDLANKDQKAADFLAINPNGKVPALVDGDAKIFEGPAILLWLGMKHGVAKGLWPKAGTPEEAEALSWTVWGNGEVLPALFDRLQHGGFGRMALPEGSRSALCAENALERWRTSTTILDRRLEGREHLVGKGFTLADLAVASTIGFGVMMGQMSLDHAKNVAAWVQRCQSRPAMAKSMAG